MLSGERLTILFDLDGTLVDSIQLILAAARHAFEDRATAPTDQQVLSTIGRPLPELFIPWSNGDADLQYLIGRYRAYQLTHHDRLLRAYPGIPEAVDILGASGHAMGVVTSKAHLLAQRALEHVGLHTYMRLVVGLEATERHKPDPAPVVHALARLGATADRAVFVGDSPWDMEAGRRAGVIPLGVGWGPYARNLLVEAGAVHIVERPAELPGAVRQLTGRG